VRAVAAALLLLAAPARADEPVRFGAPVGRGEPRPKLCPPKDAVCAGLDEDGLLPLDVGRLPRGVTVWHRDEPLRRDGRGVVLLDLLPLLAEDRLDRLFHPDATLLRLTIELRLEGPGVARDVTLLLDPDALLVKRLAARLLDGAGALPWAAAYDARAPGPHPMVVVWRWAGRRFDDLGNRMPAPDVTPFATRLRDLQLIASVEVQPTHLGRCKRCAVGDFGWPEVEFRCRRTRMDAAVEVRAARSGAPVATRRFRGLDPGPCGENVSHLAVRGGTSPEIDAWLRALVGDAS
jgi:hypothetical protein